jgi:hypothetical protein
MLRRMRPWKTNADPALKREMAKHLASVESSLSEKISPGRRRELEALRKRLKEYYS